MPSVQTLSLRELWSAILPANILFARRYAIIPRKLFTDHADNDQAEFRRKEVDRRFQRGQHRASPSRGKTINKERVMMKWIIVVVLLVISTYKDPGAERNPTQPHSEVCLHGQFRSHLGLQSAILPANILFAGDYISICPNYFAQQISNVTACRGPKGGKPVQPRTLQSRENPSRGKGP